MEFYASNSQTLLEDVVLLPQEGAVAGPTGRPPNSYAILFDDHSVLFDAVYAWNIGGIRTLIEQGKPPRAIVLSHRNVAGQIDPDVLLEFRLPVLLHPDDAKHPEASEQDVSYESLANSELLQQDELEVIHIPGHTDGSIMLYWARHGGVLFAGDSAVAPGPKQTQDPPRLLRPKMEDEATDRDFKTQWKELAAERPLSSVFPLHGTPYVEPQNIKEIVEPIWSQEPMNPSKAA